MNTPWTRFVKKFSELKELFGDETFQKMIRYNNEHLDILLSEEFLADSGIRREIPGKVFGRIEFLFRLVSALREFRHSNNELLAWFRGSKQYLGYKTPEEVLFDSGWSPCDRHADMMFALAKKGL